MGNNTGITRRKIREFWISQAGQELLEKIEIRLKISIANKIKAVRDDENKCWACHKRVSSQRLERCHIIPASSKGESSIENLILMCRQCHLESPTINHPDALWVWLSLKTSWHEEMESVCAHFMSLSNLSYEGWKVLCEQVMSDESIMPVSGQISATAWLSILIVKGAALEQTNPHLTYQDLFTRQQVLSDVEKLKRSLTKMVIDKIVILSDRSKSSVKNVKITYVELHANMQRVRSWFNQGYTVEQIKQLCQTHEIRTTKSTLPSEKTIFRWCQDLILKRAEESIFQVRQWRAEGCKLEVIHQRCRSEGIRTQRGNIPSITWISRHCKDVDVLVPIKWAPAKMPRDKAKTRIENRTENVGLAERILTLRAGGLSYDKVAKQLKVDGFRTSRGNPISKTQILRIIRNTKLDDRPES